MDPIAAFYKMPDNTPSPGSHAPPPMPTSSGENAVPSTLGAQDPIAAFYKMPDNTLSPEQQTEESSILPSAGKLWEAAHVPGQVGATMLTGAGSLILGGWKGLETLAQSSLEGNSKEQAFKDAADAVENEQKTATYHPPAGSVGETAETAMASPYNPMNWIAMGASAAGSGVSRGATYLGASPEVAGAAGALTEGGLDVGSMFLPEAGGPLARMSEAATSPIERLRGATLGDLPVNYDIPPLVRAKMAAQAGADTAGATGAAAPEQVPTGRTQLFDSVDTTPPKPLTGPALPSGQPAAGRAPMFESVDTAAPKSVTGAPVLPFMDTPKVAEPGTALPAGDQAERSALFQKIGLQNVRTSAITGDANAGATEWEARKIDDPNAPVGHLARAQFDAERGALENYATGIIKDTGGSEGLNSSDLENRGDTFLKPFDSLKKYLDTQRQTLYKAADEKAAGLPTQLNSFSETLGDDSLLSNADRVQLRSSVNAYLKKLGMVNEDGTVGGSAAQAETVRKYLNENWSPQNSGFVGKMKSALDQDVLSGAGEDIYKQARAIHAMKQQIFADDVVDPAGRQMQNGLSKIFDASGKRLKLLKSADKVPDAINSLSPEQFRHVVKILNTLPSDLQPEGQAALSGIKSQFANRLYEAGSSEKGQWSPKKVTGFLNKNAAQLQTVFSPQELANINDLSRAGQYLRTDQGYAGAFQQQGNLMGAGLVRAARYAPTAVAGTIGHMVPIPGVGAASSILGEAMGLKWAAKLEGKGALKAWKNRITDLNAKPGRASGGRVLDASTASDVERAGRQTDHGATGAQKHADNYKKGRFRFSDGPLSELGEIAIETAKGRTRTAHDGSWRVHNMPAHYGHLMLTDGNDGDKADVFIGDDLKARKVYVIDQINLKTGKFDETKSMLCFPSKHAARRAYVKSFSDGNGDERLGNITAMSPEQFAKRAKAHRLSVPAGVKSPHAPIGKEVYV